MKKSASEGKVGHSPPERIGRSIKAPTDPRGPGNTGGSKGRSNKN